MKLVNKRMDFYGGELHAKSFWHLSTVDGISNEIRFMAEDKFTPVRRVDWIGYMVRDIIFILGEDNEDSG